MNTGFEGLSLQPELLQAVTELGFCEPTPIQTLIIPLMLQGIDVLGQAQTGTGKTAAFALPVLQNMDTAHPAVQSLVLVPTRELALQVARAFEDYGAHQDVRVLAVYGGQPYYKQIGALKRGVDIVVGTPGRLLDLIERQALDLSHVTSVVLDEADEMLSMGFVEDIEAILAVTPTERQTSLFSATLPPAIRRLAEKYLRDPQSVTIQREQITVAAIEQRYYLVNSMDKIAALTRLFEAETVTSALIFSRTRAGSATLAAELSSRGYPAEVLNGDLTQEAREQVLARFRQNQIKVLVATDVAARGLDIEDISHVFNFDLPEDEEIYVHRIGRTGRAGKTGIAISLVTPGEQARLRRIEAFTRQKLVRANLPTEVDILAIRETRLRSKLTVWLQRGRYKRERELVDSLIGEGFDPAEIAAAALKVARSEEKQRPIDPISEVMERRARSIRPERPERAERNGRKSGRGASLPMNISQEEGMVRLTLNKGRVHGTRPNDVVSTIAKHANIPGYTIGKIHIQDRQTLVDVPEKYLHQVLSNASDYRIQKQPVTISV